MRIDTSGESALICGWLRLDKAGASIRATRWLSEARLKVGDIRVAALFIAPTDKAPGDGLNAGCARLDVKTAPAAMRRSSRRVAGARVKATRRRSCRRSRQAREFLLANRTAYDAAMAGFQWPEPVPFNWALDWFDAELARAPESKDRCGLWIVDVASGEETKLTFGELSTRSNQVANYLRQLGLKRGDHLLLVLNNVAPLWEIMLAAMKLGVVVIPATTLLTADELADRVERGRAK